MWKRGYRHINGHINGHINQRRRKRGITTAIAATLTVVLIAGSTYQTSAVASENAALGTSKSIADIRSRLTNLEALPLFLPAEKGTLESADDRLSSTQLSRPSFAWIRDQVAVRYASPTISAEIVNQWQAYTTNEGFQYVDVIVNESHWEQLNYLRQYGFAVQFGEVARSYGYQLRIFHTGDAANRNDVLSSEALSVENSNGNIVGSSVRLRGAYFCTDSTALSECSTFIAP